MNNKAENIENKIYFMTMYIIDYSFKQFWSLEFYKIKPIIIGYLPQIYNDICLDKKKELLLQISNYEKEEDKKLRLAAQIPQIIEVNINLSTKNQKKFKEDKNEEQSFKKGNTEENILDNSNDLLKAEKEELIIINQNLINLNNKLKNMENEIVNIKDKINMFENRKKK